MAFVFLNRYLDLAEAMDDPDAGPLENADFVDTDIPFDFHIPSKHYASEGLRQQVIPVWFVCPKRHSFGVPKAPQAPQDFCFDVPA